MLGVTSWVCALSLLAAAEESSWAVVGLAGSGVWATDLERVEDGLRQSLTGAKAGRVQPRAATAALLTEARQAGLVCDVHAPACAAKLGASAGVDRVLVLDASAQPPRLLLQVTVIDVASESVLAQARRDVDGASPEASVLDDLATEVAAPARYFGAIFVEGAPDGATIFVDGVEQARAPLRSPLTRIAPGRHVVEVKGPRTSWTGPVDVPRGTVARVRAAFPEAAPAVAAAPAAAPAAPAPVAAEVEAPATVDEPAAPFPLGLALAIGGGGAFVVGAGGAVALAALLETPLDAGTREGVRAGGVALLGLAVVGLVAGGAGAGLWMMEGDS